MNNFTHFVDFPSSVTLNGSVAKITFLIGEDVDNPDSTHTLAMPIMSFIALAEHMNANLNDSRFVESIRANIEMLNEAIIHRK